MWEQLLAQQYMGTHQHNHKSQTNRKNLLELVTSPNQSHDQSPKVALRIESILFTKNGYEWISLISISSPVHDPVSLRSKGSGHNTICVDDTPLSYRVFQSKGPPWGLSPQAHKVDRFIHSFVELPLKRAKKSLRWQYDMQNHPALFIFQKIPLLTKN